MSTESRSLKHWLIKYLLPNPGTLIILLLFILVQNTGAAPWSAPLAAPSSATTINYQGRLFDSSGNPVNGSVTLAFSLYRQASGGTAVWGPEPHNNVTVSNGLFSVLLGSQMAIPLSAISGDLWLETSVNGEKLSPREQLGAVPYAMAVPDGSITTAKITDGSVTLSKLGEQPYYFTGTLATPTEWMADVVFNGNYTRFCQAIGRTFSRADELQSHYTDWPSVGGQGNGYFYTGWYYVGHRFDSSDTHVYGNGDPGNDYNVWRYNGGAGCCITWSSWTYERSAIIWCKP